MLLALRMRTTVLALIAAVALPLAAAAHQGEHTTAADPALLAAVVSLGGGAEHFSAGTFRRALATSADEEKSLRGSMGSANVDRFDEVFTYVVVDALATMKRGGKSLPPPASTDPKIVAPALYKAGLHGTAFDVEQCFDTLFSPDIHNHAMLAVGRKYGGAGETAYHTIFARLVQDTGKS
jgi:hypothetical protein